jgi:hypothetical protein
MERVHVRYPRVPPRAPQPRPLTTTANNEAAGASLRVPQSKGRPIAPQVSRRDCLQIRSRPKILVQVQIGRMQDHLTPQ